QRPYAAVALADVVRLEDLHQPTSSSVGTTRIDPPGRFEKAPAKVTFLPVAAFTSALAITSVLTRALISLATFAYSIWLVKSPNEMKPTASRIAVPAMTGPVAMVTVSGFPPACGISTVIGPVGTEVSTLVTVPEPFTMNAYGLPVPAWWPYCLPAASGSFATAAATVVMSTALSCTVGTIFDAQASATYVLASV